MVRIHEIVHILTGISVLFWRLWYCTIHIKVLEGFNDWGGRGYDDFVPEEVTKTASSGDRTT